MRRHGLMCTIALAALGCSRPPPPALGQSNDEERIERNPSAPADALGDVVQIDADEYLTCALIANGQVLCWGAFPRFEDRTPRARYVPGIGTASHIDIGSLRSFAVDRSGEVLTWGELTGPHYRYRIVPSGKGLPRPDEDGRRRPYMVEQAAEPLDPYLSAEAAAAAYPDEVWLYTPESPGVRIPPQWRTTARAIPTRMQTDSTIFVAAKMLCTHRRDGSLSCVDSAFPKAFPSWNQSRTSYEPDVVDMIASHVPEVCLLRRDGTIDCIRHAVDNPHYWLDDEYVTVRVSLPGPAAAIASDSCPAVVLRDGHVVTWCETDDEGRLNPSPKIHTNIDDAVAVDIHWNLICIIRRNDDVTCWWEGREARFYLPEPRTVTTLDHPTQIAVGSRHACALVAGGHVQCWGGNEHGQLGNGQIEGELDENGFPPSLIPDTQPTWVLAPEDSPP